MARAGEQSQFGDFRWQWSCFVLFGRDNHGSCNLPGLRRLASWAAAVELMARSPPTGAARSGSLGYACGPCSVV